MRCENLLILILSKPQVYNLLFGEDEYQELRLNNTTKKLLGRNQKLSDYHRLSYSNFVKLAKRLYDLKINLRANAQNKWVQLGEQLENTSPLANKGWLLEKYQAMRP